MKKPNFIALLAALITCCLFSTRGQAQSMVTVSLTQSEYNQVVAQNDIGGTMVAPGQDNMFHVVPGTGPYTHTDPPSCPDELTPGIIAAMHDAANACCCRAYVCVRRSNCAYWIMFVDPPAWCQPAVFQVNQPFQAYLFQ